MIDFIVLTANSKPAPKMPAISTGDFSKYPEQLRDVLPYLEGEVCDLRGCWEVFKYLFMSDADRTRDFGERLGGVLGMFQGYLQDDMIIGIARLMDRDHSQQKNLTLWTLVDRCRAWNPTVAVQIKTELDALTVHVSEIRTHRHKRIAHFDLPVSLGKSQLPLVTFTRLREAIEKMEAILNLISQRAINTTTMFSMLDHRDITTNAAITVYKAMAYDVAVKAGKIDLLAWRSHIHEK